MWELPPPWKWASIAAWPMTAMCCGLRSGRMPLFFSSTIVSAEILRARAWWAAASKSPPLGVSAARQTIVRMRRTASSSTASSRSPLRTASMTPSTRVGLGPGISKSSPARNAATRLCTAPQSETTKPSKPHSFFRMSVSSWWCSEPKVPLMRL